MIIIHAGMHKTGSSSIQSSLYKLRGTQLDYVPWTGPNHSGLFTVMFEDAPETLPLFKRKSVTPEEVQGLKDMWSRKFKRTLRRNTADTPDRPVLFSAEAISGASEETVQRMADFVRSHAKEVRVVAYVRPPISFMTSAFQQRLKNGHKYNFRALRLWPYYRDRFEKLDRIFGRENVTLKVFSRDRLDQGDVVLDFAAEIGVDLDPSQVERSNESLSLEAAGLFHAYASYNTAEELVDRASFRNRQRFMNLMMTIGQRRFALSDTLTTPLVEANRADLDWMEERLGTQLYEGASQVEGAVSSEDDLMAAGVAAMPLVEALIAETIADEEPGVVAARKMGLLREAMRVSAPPEELTPEPGKADPKA